MKYLLTLLMMMLCVNGYCADINWSLDGTASMVVTLGSEVGTASNINDDDTDTESGAVDTDTLLAEISYTNTVTFDHVADNINDVEINHIGGSVGIASLQVYVDLYYNSSWNNVLSVDGLTDGTDSVTGPWSKVSSIRVRTVGQSRPTALETFAIIAHDTRELRALGPQNKGNYIISFL